jgi:predicted dehydrogenase
MNSNLNRREFLRTAGGATLAAATLPSAIAQADKKVVMAFVGVAHIHTPGYVDLLKKREDVRVKAVWDHEPARAEKNAKELGAQAVKEASEIWSDPEIAAVVITSETVYHHDLVLAGAKAGKHLFVEKPLGITGAESMAMAEAIEKANVLFTTGYFMRTDPKHLYLKDQVAKGNFGKVVRVRGSTCHAGALEGWFDTDYRWMTDYKLAGVGAFGDLGTHKLDILMWMLGDVESATAKLRSVTGRFGHCDESGEGLVQFKNGVLGAFSAGWVDLGDPVPLLISGTEGHAIVSDNHLYYRSKRVPDSDATEPFTKLPPAPRPPLHQFVDAVVGKKDQPLVTAREAAARVRVMEAMYRGAREGKWIKVA